VFEGDQAGKRLTEGRAALEEETPPSSQQGASLSVASGRQTAHRRPSSAGRRDASLFAAGSIALSRGSAGFASILVQKIHGGGVAFLGLQTARAHGEKRKKYTITCQKCGAVATATSPACPVFTNPDVFLGARHEDDTFSTKVPIHDNGGIIQHQAFADCCFGVVCAQFLHGCPFGKM
jgi:hypothetical protein